MARDTPSTSDERIVPPGIGVLYASFVPPFRAMLGESERLQAGHEFINKTTYELHAYTEFLRDSLQALSKALDSLPPVASAVTELMNLPELPTDREDALKRHIVELLAALQVFMDLQRKAAGIVPPGEFSRTHVELLRFTAGALREVGKIATVACQVIEEGASGDHRLEMSLDLGDLGRVASEDTARASAKLGRRAR